MSDGDFAGGLVRAFGQLADLVGHDGEAHAVLAGAGGLDGGVERQQVGLAGDFGDDADDLADLLRNWCESGPWPRSDFSTAAPPCSARWLVSPASGWPRRRCP